METTGPIPGLSGMLGRTKRGLEQKLLLPLAWAGGPLFFFVGGGGEGDHYFPGLPFGVFVFSEIWGWVKRTFHTPCFFEEDAESLVQRVYF